MVATPVIVNCANGVWQKVATNIEMGTFHAKRTEPVRYYHMYLLTGAIAPLDSDLSLAIPLSCSCLEISVDGGVDVYFQCRGGEGSVRVDV